MMGGDVRGKRSERKARQVMRGEGSAMGMPSGRLSGIREN